MKPNPGKFGLMKEVFGSILDWVRLPWDRGKRCKPKAPEWLQPSDPGRKPKSQRVSQSQAPSGAEVLGHYS